MTALVILACLTGTPGDPCRERRFPLPVRLSAETCQAIGAELAAVLVAPATAVEWRCA